MIRHLIRYWNRALITAWLFLSTVCANSLNYHVGWRRWYVLWMHNYTPAAKKFKGGMLVSFCPSVHLWKESCPLCIIYLQINFMFIHLNKQLKNMCGMLIYLQNFKIPNFFFAIPFKFVTLTLSCVHAMWKLKSWFLIWVFIRATLNFPWWYLWMAYLT